MPPQQRRAATAYKQPAMHFACSARRSRSLLDGSRGGGTRTSRGRCSLAGHGAAPRPSLGPPPCCAGQSPCSVPCRARCWACGSCRLCPLTASSRSLPMRHPVSFRSGKCLPTSLGSTASSSGERVTGYKKVRQSASQMPTQKQRVRAVGRHSGFRQILSVSTDVCSYLSQFLAPCLSWSRPFAVAMYLSTQNSRTGTCIIFENHHTSSLCNSHKLISAHFFYQSPRSQCTPLPLAVLPKRELATQQAKAGAYRSGS